MRPQEGEISFCAYNTGVGWRNIIEKMHMTATLTKWYDEHGRHEIFAGGNKVDLNSTEHNLVLDPEAVAAGLQTDLDEQGIAKNARQEKLAAREQMKQQAEDDRMAALYRQHILKEAAEAQSGVIQIQGAWREAEARAGRRERIDDTVPGGESGGPRGEYAARPFLRTAVDGLRPAPRDGPVQPRAASVCYHHVDARCPNNGSAC